jgi:hypothetical protein
VTERNSVSSGVGSDLLVASVAAMGPFLAGMLALLGLIWIGGFGVVLGLGGAVFWAVWWYRRNGALFPRDVDLAAYAITVALTVGSLILVLVVAL